MFHPTNSNYHDDRCCCPGCSGLCQDDYEYYSGTGQYASEGGLHRPTIVCLCGSTRFMEAFQEANLFETLAGRIVLSVGCDVKSDEMLRLSPDVKVMLDELHKRKIDLADEILVLNVGGYIGSSTRGEVEYARMHGKRVRWLEDRR